MACVNRGYQILLHVAERMWRRSEEAVIMFRINEATLRTLPDRRAWEIVNNLLLGMESETKISRSKHRTRCETCLRIMRGQELKQVSTVPSALGRLSTVDAATVTSQLARAWGRKASR